MGFRYTLRLADGDDAGEVELAYQPDTGDTIRLNGNRPYRVIAVLPLERAQEFVDGATHGALEVEPAGAPDG